VSSRNIFRLVLLLVAALLFLSAPGQASSYRIAISVGGNGTTMLCLEEVACSAMLKAEIEDEVEVLAIIARVSGGLAHFGFATKQEALNAGSGRYAYVTLGSKKSVAAIIELRRRPDWIEKDRSGITYPVWRWSPPIASVRLNVLRFD
jgi:hypothetical protein